MDLSIAGVRGAPTIILFFAIVLSLSVRDRLHSASHITVWLPAIQVFFGVWHFGWIGYNTGGCCRRGVGGDEFIGLLRFGGAVEVAIRFNVNGRDRTVTTDPKRPLLEVLREDLDLTGAKYGCGEGECGACTVLIDGECVKSCVMPVSSADGKKIRTIEGLGDGERLHPVQEAFLAEGAMQCGFCTPGMILRTVALLEKNPRPSDEEVVKWMDGNICRCNGYVKILNAVRRAAKKEGR